jgi:hypothetical protein
MTGALPKRLVPTGGGASLNEADDTSLVHFEIIGAVRYRHATGSEWLEWAVVFRDRDGDTSAWLSEHEGQRSLTIERSAKAFSGYVGPTDFVAEQRYQTAWGELTCVDRGTATVVSVYGELPELIEPEYDNDFVDFSGRGQRFGTLVFGGRSRDAVATGRRFFYGFTLSSDQLILDAPPPKSAAPLEPIDCIECSASMPRYLRDAAVVVCPKCMTGQAIVDGLPERVFGKQTRRFTSKLPLGRRVTLGRAVLANALAIPADNVVRPWPSSLEVLLAGFVVRSVVVDGETYFFEEYYLDGGDVGQFWLVLTDGKWYLVRRANAAEIEEASGRVIYGGVTFPRQEQNNAKVVEVHGESHYRIAPGEENSVADYVFQSRMISKEDSLDEGVWTEGVRVEPSALEQAFGISLPRESATDSSWSDDSGEESAAKPNITAVLQLLGLIIVVCIFIAILADDGGCSGGGYYGGSSYGFGK